MTSIRQLKGRTFIKSFGVLALMAGLTSPFAHVLAAEKDKPLWELSFVAAGTYLPHYPAAAESQARFLQFPWLVYRGEIFRAGEDGVLSGRIIKSERVELDVSFSGSLPVSSDDNDAREGMPELDWLGGIGPRLQMNLFRTGNSDRNARIDFQLPVRGVFSTDFSETPEWRGVVAALGIRYRNKNVSRSGLNLDLSAEVIFATEELMDYYYEVDPQFARSNRPAYDADAGYLGSKFSFNMNRKFGSRITGFINTNLQWFSGSTNSDSPLSLETVNYGFVAGIKVALFQSDDWVRD